MTNVNETESTLLASDMDDFFHQLQEKKKLNAQKKAAKSTNSLKKTKRINIVKENGYQVVCYTTNRKNETVVADTLSEKMLDDGKISRENVPMVYYAETIQAAEGIAHRRLFNNYHVEYALITNPKFIGKNGLIVFKVDRNTAIHNMLKNKGKKKKK